MVNGIEPLQGLRSALETTRGTAVTTATRIQYPSSVAMVQDVGNIIPQELWGNYTAVRRHYPGLERVGLQVAGDVTYTDMPWWLSLAVVSSLTGSVTDTSAYNWSYTPNHVLDNVQSATFEIGDKGLIGTVGWRIPGCVINELTVTWRKAGIGGEETGLTFQAALMTASGASQITAFTGSLSDRAVVSATGLTTVSSINGTGSAHGTTADPQVREASFTINNGFVYQDGFDGTNHATRLVKSGQRKATMTIQRWFADKTELDAYIAKTVRRIQLLTTGALVGATTATNAFRLQVTGFYTDHTPAWVDGVLAANLTFTAEYDTSPSTDFTFVVTNADATTLT